MISDKTMDVIIEKNVMVAMHDGVKLATDIYRPGEKKPVPVLLARLPYNKERPTTLAFSIDRFLQAGYAVVIQDMRGRYASEGEFTLTKDEPRDGVDTITWLVQQPWSNGQVGMFGASYLGIPQWLVASEQPSALLALAPMHTRHSLYSHQGGAFELGLWLNWALMQGGGGEIRRRIAQERAAPEELEVLAKAELEIQSFYTHLPLLEMPLLKKTSPYFFDWLTHGQDEPARHLQAQSECYSKITVPALNIAGWYDMFLDGAFENYLQMKRFGGSEAARNHQHLLIGPWAHFDLPGIFPERDYGPKATTSAVDLVGIHLRWFDHWLKAVDNGVDREKPVHIFVMGADSWRSEDDWPLPDTQYCHYYLHSQGHANTAAGDGMLSLEPAEQEPEDSYCYDPRNPVPTIGGANLLPIEGGFTMMSVTPRTSPYLFQGGPRDQQEIEQREDVLCYTTAPFEQPIEVTGPIELILSISSSALDTDFTGKLVDVYPDGRAEILTDGILRVRYRESLAQPMLMEPEQIYTLRIALGATANLFRAGHRIRLEVSSSNFPRFDRNTNTGGTIIGEHEEDLRQAINRIYHDQAHPSYLTLPIIAR